MTPTEGKIGWPERIKERLKELKMTQEELANQTGVTRSAITHYLAGRRIPSLGQFVKLAKVLKTNPGWLQYGSYIEIPTKAAQNLLEKLHRVPILSWEQAIDFTDIRDLNPEGIKEWVPHFYTESTNSYGLRIKGDAMTSPTGQGKSFQEGDIIVVDYGKIANPGDFVIAVLPDSNEVTFKQYVYDGGIRYLKPLNPQYPIIQITDEIYLHAVFSYCVSTLIAVNKANNITETN